MLRANGSTLVKPGYIAVYKEGRDDASEDDNDRILPPINVGDQLELLTIRPEQHFTEPPPRYSEASLVKALEEHGIGRPSTYASIIATLIGKKYTELLNRRFTPTDLGKIVNRFLTRNFHHYIEYGFTAKMEDDLDEIADGKEEWVPVLDRFWSEFKDRVDHVDKSVTREDVSEARELGVDPVSGQSSIGALRQVRALRPARHEGRRREAQIREPASASADGRPDASGCARAVQAAAYARQDGRRARDQGCDRPVRSLHPVRREEVRLDQGRRSVRSRVAASARTDPRQGRARREPHHSRFPGRRDSGAERPLRAVHHRSREEREDPEGPRAEDADTGRMQGVARSGARARQGAVRPIREESTAEPAAQPAAAAS